VLICALLCSALLFNGCPAQAEVWDVSAGGARVVAGAEMMLPAPKEADDDDEEEQKRKHELHWATISDDGAHSLFTDSLTH
jgi:hypothetical protein